MNGEARILQPEQSVNMPGIEEQPILNQRTAATIGSTKVLPNTESTRLENRFMRLKRHLRKRSASIL